jgi:osmotically-inducible protein OsmY
MRFAHIPRALFASFMILTMVACAPTEKREGTGEYIDDAVITTKVKAALAADPDVKATEVKVKTYKGVVQLSGFVSSADAARKAVEIARKVEGVREVKNDMEIK